MKCGNCGAILTLDGRKHGAVGTRVEVEAHAHAMDTNVKCWRCGWEVTPTMKPSDRPKLHRGNTDGGMFGGKVLSAFDLYARQGRLSEIYRKVRGRRVA